MAFCFWLVKLAKLALLSSAVASASSVCDEIANAVGSSSEVSYPGSVDYANDIFHYAESSSQPSMCSVEPGTVEDVAAVIEVVGRTRTAFGIKSGGHIMNPRFSSSPGVQISLSRFNDTVYNPNTQTAIVGSGQIWDDVYAALQPYNESVLGGRVPGIGVGGLLLGGGYSWQTNQFGLALDNVLAYELVLPTAEIVNVTSATYPDLFFALKGGYNNFGIVTRFTLQTYPQGPVWVRPSFQFYGPPGTPGHK